MGTPARRERHLLAEELLRVGPDAPTLCSGWSTRDLAAHVVVRERRPDAALGIVSDRFATRTAKVQDRIAGQDWERLIDLVRSGPPVWSPTRIGVIDRLANTAEFFVHLEDVRRASDGWTARELDEDLRDDLFAALRRAAKLLGRRAPGGLVLQPDGGRAAVTARRATSSEPTVTVRGPVGELVLWMFGRSSVADVALDGPPEAVDAVRSTAFGV
ncbi:MAG: TIGR03085 family metal-binding protein [Ilumatobacteraceae bacterium]